MGVWVVSFKDRLPIPARGFLVVGYLSLETQFVDMTDLAQRCPFASFAKLTKYVQRTGAIAPVEFPTSRFPKLV
jgi:hypothetical protein